MKYDIIWQHPNYYQLAIANELAEANRLKKIELKLSLTTSMDKETLDNILKEIV